MWATSRGGGDAGADDGTAFEAWYEATFPGGAGAAAPGGPASGKDDAGAASDSSWSDCDPADDVLRAAQSELQKANKALAAAGIAPKRRGSKTKRQGLGLGA